jgi:hypothetical protein
MDHGAEESEQDQNARKTVEDQEKTEKPAEQGEQQVD